jgi:hypothetical protein
MTDTFISKRLHISGLTSAISADDLTRRLGSFGKVTALDGLGALDALGQQRKFAYATLETTPSQLQRCAFISTAFVDHRDDAKALMMSR